MTTLRKDTPSFRMHPVLIVFIIISFITGTFLEVFIIIGIVIIHEFGHYFMARLLKWRIESVVFWVFGGVMKTAEFGTRSIKEEVLVTVGGPFQHVLIYLALYLTSFISILPESIWQIIFSYNTIILLFNLLPIWPLDGGKLFFLLVANFFPYRTTYHFTIVFSIILSFILLIVQLIYFPFTLSSLLIMLFLLMENKTEWQQRFYVFIRFLLGRLEDNNCTFKKRTPLVVPAHYLLMDVFSCFKYGKEHIIIVRYPNNQRKKISEQECLNHYFNDRKYKQIIGRLL